MSNAHADWKRDVVQDCREALRKIYLLSSRVTKGSRQQIKEESFRVLDNYDWLED